MPSLRWRGLHVACLALGIMATGTFPFSDAAIMTANATGVTTVTSDDADDSHPLGKVHADSKEDGSDHPPPWLVHNDGSGGRHGRLPRDGRRDNSSHTVEFDDDEIIPATCGYYARRKADCAAPRRCRACLKMNGCMINQFSACVNMTARPGYEPAMDFRKAFELDLVGANASNSTQTLRFHFPAVNATYCKDADATCTKCKETVFAGDVTDSRFCVGKNGCICIATCEASGWEQLAGGLRCGPPLKPKFFSAADEPPPTIREEKGDRGGVNWRDVWTMGGIPALVVVVGILVIRSHRRESRRREEAARRELESDADSSNEGDTTGSTSQTRRPGRLNLSGWKSLRNHLIKKENLLLNGAEDISPKHRFVDMLEAQQDGVNPEVTILAAPVMGAVMVEASAPSMSPTAHGGVEPSAPSFDSDYTLSDEDRGMV